MEIFANLRILTEYEKSGILPTPFRNFKKIIGKNENFLEAPVFNNNFFMLRNLDPEHRHLDASARGLSGEKPGKNSVLNCYQ
jgi:hypothetical protein